MSHSHRPCSDDRDTAWLESLTISGKEVVPGQRPQPSDGGHRAVEHRIFCASAIIPNFNDEDTSGGKKTMQ